MSTEGHYDVILIGSGLGSLTVASLLAQVERRKVLVLEKHWKTGGFTQTFERKGRYLWDVGFHYVGGMARGKLLRRLFDSITRGAVDWRRMPDPFEKFVYPGLTFEVSGDEARYRSDLVRLFPEEEDAIGSYFDEIKEVADWFARRVSTRCGPGAFEKAADFLRVEDPGRILGTTAESLGGIRDKRLWALLLSQWPDYGMPPRDSSFVIHALVAASYLGGGYYPIGGADAITNAIRPILEEAGGTILLRHEVGEILLRGDRAVGVRAVEQVPGREAPKDFSAEEVVSGAGAATTYLKLLPREYPLDFREELETLPSGLSSIALYAGLKESPTCLGFHGENHWIYSDYDHEASYQKLEGVLQGHAPAGYLSFPSLKDLPPGGGHTAEIITFIPYEPFEPWRHQRWRKRNEAYQGLKRRIGEGLLDLVEAHYPGFRDLIDFTEVSTPLTIEHFTGHRRGAIYGLPCTPDRFVKPWASVKTPVENLYLTGVDVSSPGIQGAVVGGFATANALLGGKGLADILWKVEKARRA